MVDLMVLRRVFSNTTRWTQQRRRTVAERTTRSLHLPNAVMQ
jgi:hypothetical protein